MQRTPRSFIKNGKERKNVAFFWKERMPNPAKNEWPWAIRSGCSPQMSNREQIAQVTHQNEQIACFYLSESLMR